MATKPTNHVRYRRNHKELHNVGNPRPDPGHMAIRNWDDEDEFQPRAGVLVMRTPTHFHVFDGDGLHSITEEAWDRTFLEDLPAMDVGYYRVVPVLTWTTGARAGTQTVSTVTAGLLHQAFLALREWENEKLLHA